MEVGQGKKPEKGGGEKNLGEAESGESPRQKERGHARVGRVRLKRTLEGEWKKF